MPLLSTLGGGSMFGTRRLMPTAPGITILLDGGDNQISGNVSYYWDSMIRTGKNEYILGVRDSSMSSSYQQQPYKSVDGGVTWAPLYSTAPISFDVEWMNHAVFDGDYTVVKTRYVRVSRYSRAYYISHFNTNTWSGKRSLLLNNQGLTQRPYHNIHYMGTAGELRSMDPAGLITNSVVNGNDTALFTVLNGGSEQNHTTADTYGDNIMAAQQVSQYTQLVHSSNKGVSFSNVSGSYSTNLIDIDGVCLKQDGSGDGHIIGKISVNGQHMPMYQKFTNYGATWETPVHMTTPNGYTQAGYAGVRLLQGSAMYDTQGGCYYQWVEDATSSNSFTTTLRYSATGFDKDDYITLATLSTGESPDEMEKNKIEFEKTHESDEPQTFWFGPADVNTSTYELNLGAYYRVDGLTG